MSGIPVLVLDPAAVGGRVLARRLELGFRQTDLAARARVGSKSTLVWIEKGRNLPTLDLATRLADALEVTLDWLVGREASASTPSPTHTVGEATAHVPGGGVHGAASAQLEQTGSLTGLAGSTPSPVDPSRVHRPDEDEGGGLLDPTRDTAPGCTREPVKNSA